MGKNKGAKEAAAAAAAPAAPQEIMPVPGFFGHVLKPGTALVWDNEDEEFALQLTAAALGPKVTGGRSTLIADAKDVKIALCTLIPEKTEQWNVTHLFTPYDGRVTFHNEGVNDIHLTGLIDVQDEEEQHGHSHGEGNDSSDDDSEMGVPGMYSDSDSDDSGEMMIFGSGDDEEDDSDDDDEEEAEKRFEVLEERVHGDVGEKKKSKTETPKKAAKKEAAPAKNESKKDATPSKKDATPAKKEVKKDEVAKKPAADKIAEPTGPNAKKRPAPVDAVEMPKKAKTTRLYKGVTIDEVAVGKGQPVAKGKKVSIIYRGRLESGKQFDAQQNRKKPFTFRHGIGDVIKGMDIGIEGMRTGGKRTITIPSHLGYGKSGAPPTIPGNSTLVFEIELL